MSNNKLDIKALPNYGEKKITCYFVEEHVNKQNFVSEVNRIYGVKIDINKVEHTHGRDKKQFGTYLLEKCKESQSGYLMTYVEV